MLLRAKIVENSSIERIDRSYAKVVALERGLEEDILDYMFCGYQLAIPKIRTIRGRDIRVIWEGTPSGVGSGVRVSKSTFWIGIHTYHTLHWAIFRSPQIIIFTNNQLIFYLDWYERDICELFCSTLPIIFSTARLPACLTFSVILPHMFKVRQYFKMYHAIARSIFIAGELKIPHLKALGASIPNQVSHSLYHDRLGRERVKRVRVLVLKYEVL